MSDSVPPAPARPAADWPARLRWFAAEFLVVVTGVLVAFAVNAWWSGRQDAAREEAYLRQLDADLTGTESLVETYDRYFRRVDSTAALLLRAYRAPDRAPSDSLLAWLLVGNGVGLPRPVLGTAEALVTTGDLALLQSDSLRYRIVSYLELNRALLDDQQAVGEIWRRGFLQVSERVDLTDVQLAAGLSPETADSLARADPSYTVPSGDRIRPFPVEPEALLRDRQMYHALWTMNSSKRSLAEFRARMLESARDLHRLVRAELDDG